MENWKLLQLISRAQSQLQLWTIQHISAKIVAKVVVIIVVDIDAAASSRRNRYLKRQERCNVVSVTLAWKSFNS